MRAQCQPGAAKNTLLLTLPAAVSEPSISVMVYGISQIYSISVMVHGIFHIIIYSILYTYKLHLIYSISARYALRLPAYLTVRGVPTQQAVSVAPTQLRYLFADWPVTHPPPSCSTASPGRGVQYCTWTPLYISGASRGKITSLTGGAQTPTLYNSHSFLGLHGELPTPPFQMEITAI